MKRTFSTDAREIRSAINRQENKGTCTVTAVEGGQKLYGCRRQGPYLHGKIGPGQWVNVGAGVWIEHVSVTTPGSQGE